MDYLFIERAVDENNEPMLYAEHWGYDDRETPEDETDDEHLYFIRWYVLKDSTRTGDRCLNAWLQANVERRSRAIMYNANRYWLIRGRIGPTERVEGPFLW